MPKRDDELRNAIIFRLNGEEHRIVSPPPTRTLLEFLRDDAGCVGVKEGCAEGDCGACTILVAQGRSPDQQLRPINSCIFYLPMADGLDLISVEGVRVLSPNTELHPVQEAMVAEHASQCGFCTPGFVMAIAAWASSSGDKDESGLRDALAGNLCRCTGYGPILKAGLRVKDAVDVPELGAACVDIPVPVGYMTADGNAFFAPRTLADLLSIYGAHKEATLVAGATDVGLWTTKQGRPLATLISLQHVEELRTIAETPSALRLGAAVTYAEAHQALMRLHPGFARYVARIGGPQVRQSGTIGGNIANGSPIGDMPPALIALGAEIELASQSGTRQMPLQDFFIAYGKQDRRPGEVLTAIIIPRPAATDHFAAEKISKRQDQDISAVSAGIHVVMKGQEVAMARLAFGGMAGIPMRAKAAEAALVGRTLDESAIAAALKALSTDFTPLSDHRASADYRLKAAQGLLQRFWLQRSSPANAPDLVSL